jgi:undecaprenyl-diphosphatase
MNVELPLLEMINSQFTSSWADHFFLFITNLHKYWWVRFLLLPAILIAGWWKFRTRALLVLGMMAVTIGLSDWVNHNFIKPSFARPRPFLEHPQIQNKLSYKPGGYSFPSNHAVNCMAAAAVLSIFAPAWTAALVIYAGLIGYSRMYLGVHYPTDILAGWILGWFWGELCVILVRRYRPEWIPHQTRRKV